jgi:hypothetical protein
MDPASWDYRTANERDEYGDHLTEQYASVISADELDPAPDAEDVVAPACVEAA